MNQEKERSAAEQLDDLEFHLARVRSLRRLGCYDEAVKFSYALAFHAGKLAVALAREQLAAVDGKEARP